MTGTSYYYCSQNHFLYGFENTARGETILRFKNLSVPSEWIIWPIVHVRDNEKGKKYRVESPIEGRKAIFFFPAGQNKSPELIFRIQTSEKPRFEKMELLEIDLPQTAAVRSSNTKASFFTSKKRSDACPRPPRNSLDLRPGHSYTLSAEQLDALKQHKAMLEKRRFDYRILSYLFKTGYSRQEKIAEISNLLEGKQVRSEVLEQGRTGRILAS